VLVEHGGVDRSTGYANAKVFLFLLMVVLYMEVGLPFIDNLGKEILHNGKFRSRRNDNGIFRTIKKWNIPYNEKQHTDT
jgi:hypothetical protein